LKLGIVGLGWLGKAVGSYFLERSITVVGTTRSPHKKTLLESLGFQVAIWDSEAESDLRELTHCFSGCTHVLINIPPGKVLIPDAYALVCASAMSFLQKECRLIFISSTGIYPNYVLLAKEDTPYSDLIKGSLHLALAEKKMQSLLGERLTIIRFAGLIGHDRHPAHYLSGKKDLLNGNQPVNLIHIDDCIQLIEKIITQDKWDTIYNGCCSDHPTKASYYENACLSFGILLPHFSSDSSVASKKVSNDKSIIELGMNYKQLVFSKQSINTK